MSSSAIVNAAYRVKLDQELSQHTVKEISLCYGGLSNVAVAASQTEQSLVGRYCVTELCGDRGRNCS